MEYSNWSNLHGDILALIAERLSDDLMDIGRLRAVCSTWHSSFRHPLRSSPVFPLQVPCPYKPTDSIPTLFSHPFFLTERILLRLFPLDDNNTHDPWIIRVVETGPNKWSLCYPVGTQYLTSQFPYNSTHQMPHHINLLHYKVHVINRSYHLNGLIHEKISKLINDVVYDEAVVQSETGTVKADDQNFSVLIIYTSKQLAYWRSGDEMWTPVESGDCDFTGITCYQGDFYALDSNDGRLMRVDLDKSAVEIVIKLHQQVDDYMCLVNFENCLFLMTYRLGFLRSYDDGVEIFRLYILNEKDGAWDAAKDLRNGVFFFAWYTKVLPILAEDLGCPKGNFVYHNNFPYFIKEDGASSGTCTPLVCDRDSIFATSIRGRWHHQLPFWPPPCWIMQTNKHEDSHRKVVF